jgi:streptogramin lyase
MKTIGVCRTLMIMAVFVRADGAVSTRPADVVEELDQPCRAKQILGASIVIDRQDHRERLILLNNNETYHCELLYIDFEKNIGEVFAAPAGAGSWCGIEIPGDRYVIGTFYDGSFLFFDLKNKTFTKTVGFPGENYLWNLVLGGDGRVYGGTYPGGKLGAVNIISHAFEDLGAPAPPNQYLRYVSYAPWGQIFANFGMNKPTTKVYDLSTKSWRDVPDLKEGQTFGIGLTWNGYFIASDPRTGRVEAFSDASLKPLDKRPFPVPAAGTFTIDPFASTERTLYLTQGTALYRYSAGDAKFELQKLTEIDLRGGRMVGATKDGRVVGVRGQSYFVLRPDEKDLELRPIPVESRGRPMLFLKGDPEGRIWGGPQFGQTLFYYDPKAGKPVNTEVICDAGGEVYDVTFHRGLVFAASYSGGDITSYDPSLPWDQWHHKNPRPLATVAPEYIRPTGGIVTGPDGKLYAGWMARYGTYGGAVSITDPDSGKTELVENPLGKQAIAAVAVDRKYIYIATSLSANGLPDQPGETKFGVIDRVTRRKVFEKPMPVAAIAVEPKSSAVLLASRSRLYRYDPVTASLTELRIPDLPGLTGNTLIPAGDGTLVTAAGERVVRIDPAGKTFNVIAQSKSHIGALALDAAGKVYWSHGPDLYRK